jgi:chromate transporter
MTLLAILGVFALLSILAVGGGTAVLPEMKLLLVERMHWLTADQFGDVYSLGQLAPGPNMLMVSVVGWRVAGLAGALAATVGFFLPSSVLMYVAGRAWDRLRESPWRQAVQDGLAPLVIGLMLAGGLVLARAVIDGPVPVGVAIVSTVVLLLTRLHPLACILAGGAAGLLLGS